ncbi:MAG: ATP-binding protein [Mariniphaga sp.]
MKVEKKADADLQVLRHKAEGLAKKKLKIDSRFSKADMLKLIHELEVHQIELELQNETLIEAKEQADISTRKYIELYDFAPSGYLTLSKQGEIVALNICGSKMLGKEPSYLKDMSFGYFVSDCTRLIFNLFLGRIFNSNVKEFCEVILSTEGNLPIAVHLSGIVNETGVQCLISIIDITERKQAEETLEQAEITHNQLNEELEFRIGERTIELLNITIKVEERERNRFSRELHDGLGPILATVKLYFQWLAKTNNAEKIKIITEKGNYYIECAIQTAHEVALGLNSQKFESLGFVRTLLSYTEALSDVQKLAIKFTFNTDERFGYFLETTLYRITSELINNTIKYAHATRVKIDFNYRKEINLINFSYVDNGIGFDFMNIEKTSKGLGLLNIQQRIEMLRGVIRIESCPGAGINVFIELPIPQPGNDPNPKN